MPSKGTRPGTSAAEREDLVAGWERSGLTQREYCRQTGILVTTFDYYRRRQLARAAATQRTITTPLVRVRLAEEQPAVPSPATAPVAGFAVTLRNGRHVESGWEYPAAALAQLIVLVEQA